MFCILINIICNNQGVLNSVINNVPSANDSRVNPDWYEELTIGNNQPDSNDTTLTGRIRFNNESDARNIRATLRSLNGVLQLCEDGSTIEAHDCFIDTDPTLCKKVPLFYDRKINGQIVSNG